jgi:LPS-assembly protein
LRSRAFVEGFRARNYATATALVYQGLREDDDNDEFPIIAPAVGYSFVGEPDADTGGKFHFDTGLRPLTRIDGRDSVRIGINGGYEFPYIGPIGDVYSLKAQVQAEGYWTDGVQPGSNDVNPDNPNGNDVTGRVLPQLALNWRYPWLQDNVTWQQVVEPIAQIVLAPPTGNPNEIPNEDSLGFEFDDSNIFELNRFPGLDVADSGSRLDYGLSWRGDWGVGSSADAFFGQSFQIIEPNQDIFPDNSGVGKNFSDFVGRVQITPFQEFDIMYRFRLDDANLKARRNEVETRFGVPAFNVKLGYLFADNQKISEEFGKREELNFSAGSQLTNNWSISGSHRRNLERDRALSWSVGLAYNDECFTFEGVFQRKFFDDREIEPEDSILFRISFKHLGGVGGIGYE